MSLLLVRSALESRLGTWAAARTPVLRVAWENSPFTPLQAETYLRAFVLPADTEGLDLSGTVRGFVGVFQVSIVIPLNVGTRAAALIVDEIATLFPVNGRYTSGSVTTQIITPASAAVGFQDEASYLVPVSFEYRAYTVN